MMMGTTPCWYYYCYPLTPGNVPSTAIQKLYRITDLKKAAWMRHQSLKGFQQSQDRGIAMSASAVERKQNRRKELKEELAGHALGTSLTDEQVGTNKYMPLRVATDPATVVAVQLTIASQRLYISNR